MNITDVQVKPSTRGNKRCLAFEGCVLEYEFAVHDIRLVQAESGVILAMLSEEHRATFKDIAHPISNPCRRRIRKQVIRAYKKSAAAAD